MLFLLFQCGPDRYALETSRVVEVLPLLNIQKLPGVARGVAGLFSYHGQPVPVLDLAQLTQGRASEERLSTRVVVVQCSDAKGEDHLLGLIAENALDLIRKEAGDFLPSGVNLGDAPFLGPVTTDKAGVIHWLHEQRLLPDNVRELVQSEAAEMCHGND